MGKSATLEMRHYLTCLWPGLAELWWRGRLSGLAPAICFAVALNLLLVVRFIYPQWLSGIVVSLACWVGIAAWAFFVLKSVKELPNLLVPRQISEEPDRFQDAQFAYLRADWGEAESLLMNVLSIEPRDPPALLMLSGVFRQTDRPESARSVIQELKRLEIADEWAVEIDAELSRIGRDLGESDAADEQEGDDAEESKENAQESNEVKPADLTAA